MAGRQLNFAVKGEQYEKAFDSIASGVMSVVRTPRGPDDYGIDAFCHVRRPLDALSSTVGGTFGVQVRGPCADLQFGGTLKGTWKSYEIEWLRSLAVPLYLARVSSDCLRVDLYSLWPIWMVLGQSRAPFRITCQLDEPAGDPQVLKARSSEIQEGSHGDANDWTVPLGPPFLSLTQADMNNTSFLAKCAGLLITWLAIDRGNIILALQGVPYVKGIKEWATNDFAATVLQIKEFMAWSASPPKVIELARVLEPVIVNLGVHLQAQGDRAVYGFIPVLGWLDTLNVLSGFGKGLLNGIAKAERAGLLPNQQPSGGEAENRD